MTVNEYNGWTNYETWAVNLWLTNDQGTSDYWYGQAAEIFTDDTCGPYCKGLTQSQKARYELERRLTEWADENVPELDGPWSDLLGRAIANVNWFEIADAFLEDCDGYQAESHAGRP